MGVGRRGRARRSVREEGVHIGQCSQCGGQNGNENMCIIERTAEIMGDDIIPGDGVTGGTGGGQRKTLVTLLRGPVTAWKVMCSLAWR